MEKLDLINAFKNKKGKSIEEFKKAAVTIPIIEENNKLFIIFEKRASTLRYQPGDICFPGGKLEEGESFKECAIRETIEELNIEDSNIEILGEMNYMVTYYSLVVYPFVIFINDVSKVNPSKDEVDKLIKVPLDFLIEHEPIFHKTELYPNINGEFPFYLLKNGKEHKFSKGFINNYFYVYEEEVIRGITARILKDFVDIIKTSSKL